MGRYKVCVYAICKNEEAFVDKWMDSMQEADLVVVTDTGSEDGTVERLKARGVNVYQDLIQPWRFDVARNRSLEHVPKDVDICVCTDLDERFVPGWRKALEDAWQPGETTMVKYVYNWSLHPDGTPNVQFTYFKAHGRLDYLWHYPVHECLKYVGKKPERIAYTSAMVLNHYPDPKKSRGSYLPLLELAVQETPEDDRMVYYLGREYMYKGLWEKCIETLKRHLSLKSATWKEERCASMRWIARSYERLKNPEQAYCWYLRAIAEAPGMREPYVECAQMGYRLLDWPLVFFMAEKALQIKNKSPIYVNMGYCWDYTPDDLAAIASYRLGLYEKALEHAETALSFSPQDKRLLNNKEIIQKMYNAQKK